MKRTYKVGSLFAGIGGICLGFKLAGAKIAWANEIDESACKVYRLNFDGAKLVERDIKEVKVNEIPDFDIMTAGWPCQSFSIAGCRSGLKDERGNLFFEIVRVLRAKKPRAFLLENVKNLAGHDKGKTFKIIKEALCNEGYHFKYSILNTMEYGNIPQNRERVYIVGFKNEKECRSFSFPEKIPLKKSIHDIIDINHKEEDKYYYNKTKYYKMLKEAMQNKNTVYQIRRVYIRENKSNVCPTLTANMGTGGHNVPLIKDKFDIRKLTPKECLMFQGFPENFKVPDDLPNSKIYKLAGNSVSIPVVNRIAENILRVLATFDSGESCISEKEGEGGRMYKQVSLEEII